MNVDYYILTVDPDQPVYSSEMWKNLATRLSCSMQAAKNGEEPFFLSASDDLCAGDVSPSSCACAVQMRIVYELDTSAQISIPKEIQLLRDETLMRFPLPEDIQDEMLAAAFILILASLLDQTHLFSVRNGKLIFDNEPLLSFGLQITDIKKENGEKENLSVTDPSKEKEDCLARLKTLQSEDSRLNGQLDEIREKAFEQL